MLSNVDLRTPEIMKEAIDINRANEPSIHTEINFFWKFDDFNIYEATVPDRMHMLDLGITKYLLEFTREYLQQKVNAKAVKDMDHRLCTISRYPGLIILKNGLENISKFTANDYRNIMKVIIFVIDNLYENYKEGVILCKRLCKVFYLYLTMYMKLRQESYTDMELAELQVNIIKYLTLNFRSVNIDKVFIFFYQTYITEFCQEFVDVFSEYSSSSCEIPKLHVLRYHVVSS